MSTSPDTGLDLEDLELQLLPAWAKQSTDTNRYARYDGGDTGPGGRGRERREGRATGATGPDRRRRDEAEADRRRRPRGERGGPRRGEGGGRFERSRREEKPAPVQPLPEVSVSFFPEEKGVESLARQIKLTGRAYPIFDVAHLVLRKPERYHVAFSVMKNPDGQVAQQLWVCNLDETLWLAEQDAVDHVLKKHFDTFYTAEKTPTDPPKGTYTFVAQCGLSGVILGPPNYHDYQNKLRKLHSERFSRMPFEVYKSKVKIVKDEAVVKKWTEEQSWKTEYVCLNVPEAKKLANGEEVERHFRETHLGNIIKTVDSYTLSGAAAQQLPAQPLRQLLRRAWDEQQRFPIKVVTELSKQFAAQGLQFFKVNKTITHVAVARPHYLDLEATPVSDGVRRIVEYINATPGCTRRKLLEAMTPACGPTVVSAAAPAAGEAGTDKPPAAVPAPPAQLPEPTPEQTAVIADLHWLIHQGHVLEFANGRIETARKPLPKPPRPEPKRPETDAQQPASSDETTAGELPSQREVDHESAPANQVTPQAPAMPEGTGGSPASESPGETSGATAEPVSQADPEAEPGQGA